MLFNEGISGRRPLYYPCSRWEMFPLFAITEFDNRSLFERSIIGLSGDLITELFFLSDASRVLYLLWLTLLLEFLSIYGPMDCLFPLLQIDYFCALPLPTEWSDSVLAVIEFWFLNFPDKWFYSKLLVGIFLVLELVGAL